LGENSSLNLAEEVGGRAAIGGANAPPVSLALAAEERRAATSGATAAPPPSSESRRSDSDKERPSG
jgi:hypothetical protein